MSGVTTQFRYVTFSKQVNNKFLTADSKNRESDGNVDEIKIVIAAISHRKHRPLSKFSSQIN